MPAGQWVTGMHGDVIHSHLPSSPGKPGWRPWHRGRLEIPLYTPGSKKAPGPGDGAPPLYPLQSTPGAARVLSR